MDGQYKCHAEILKAKAEEMRSHASDANKRSGQVSGKEQTLRVGHGNVHVLIHEGNAPAPCPVFFNIHGGGFIMGEARDEDMACKSISDRTGFTVVNIDYRLAPEYPFPAGLEDCYSAIGHIAQHAAAFGIDASRMAVGGHSAGGNLSAAVCIKAGELKEFSLRLQILDFPALDLFTDPAKKRNPSASVPIEDCRFFNECYTVPGNRKNPLVSPVYSTSGQLSGMPPTVVITAGEDSLCDEAELYASKLIAAGVPVFAQRFAGCAHGFTFADLPQADKAWQIITDALLYYLGAPGK